MNKVTRDGMGCPMMTHDDWCLTGMTPMIPPRVLSLL